MLSGTALIEFVIRNLLLGFPLYCYCAHIVGAQKLVSFGSVVTRDNI